MCADWYFLHRKHDPSPRRNSVSEQLSSHIRPELFDQVVGTIKGDLGSHRVGEVSGVALIVRIIGAADSACSCGCHDFWGVKDGSSRIGTCYEHSRRRIPSSREKFAAPHPVISGIGVKNRRIHAHTKKLSSCSICEIGSVPFSVALSALSVSLMNVEPLVDT